MPNIRWYSVILFCFILVFLTGNTIHGQQQPNMDVHFIDVGQGDCILIETPGDKTILIDGGMPESGEDIVNFLTEQQIKKIDLLVVTHPDIDHIGGLSNVMKTFKIERILDSGKLYTTKTYRKYLGQIAKKDIPVEIAKKNQMIKLDSSLEIRVLNTYEPFRSNNESSIVLKVTYNKMDFLFMGDIGKKQEKALTKIEDLQAEVLKVAHHGSRTSSSKEFLEKVKPQVAILTYSKENDYGHPVGRVIQNLYKVDAFIFSTAVFGNITISTNGNEYYIWTEKGPTSGLQNN